PERMLDRLAPLAHFFWVLVEPALDGLENLLMLPTRDPSLLAGGAAVLVVVNNAGFSMMGTVGDTAIGKRIFAESCACAGPCCRLCAPVAAATSSTHAPSAPAKQAAPPPDWIVSTDAAIDAILYIGSAALHRRRRLWPTR